MALAKSIEKLKKYYTRLQEGKAKKIKPSHVERVMEKLSVRERNLLDELAAANKLSKKKRLNQKLEETRKQIDRARWLKDRISR
jgi:hypothetical protein